MAEPLVFIPGMMCDGRLCAPQIAAFSADRPILHFTPVGGISMAGFAQKVLNIAPPAFALLGLSMGGIVAMEVIRQAPERVTRVALLDTNPLADPPAKAPIREAQVDKVMNGDLLERDRLGQPVGVGGGVNDLEHEAAMHRRRCLKADGRVDIVDPQLAGPRGRIRNTGLHADTVTDRQACNTLSDRSDDAGHLVAEHHRSLNHEGADPPARLVVNVAAADADHGRLDTHILRPHVQGNVDLAQPQLTHAL